jgi:hypothetical protein
VLPLCRLLLVDLQHLVCRKKVWMKRMAILGQTQRIRNSLRNFRKSRKNELVKKELLLSLLGWVG